MSTNIQLVNEFSELINSSKGQVIFVTEEGDRLVANSMLSALVGFAAILSVAERIQVHFECEYDEDRDRIVAFMQKHHLGGTARIQDI